jgi:formylglycine-generating enzyme required for sulfatase activity
MGAIFISYTGRDAEGDAWADRLVGWFQEWNYGYFRDKHPGQGVKAGDDWRASLHRQLGRAQVVISLCSPSYQLSSWCMWELAAAEERGKWIIPIQFGKQEVPSLLGHRQVIRVANARQPTASQLAEVKERLARVLLEQLDWRRLQPWDPSRSPYPGLLAFEAEQAPVFFGQDKAIEKLGERLASLAQRAPAALLVLGASGTGKSSLVRAGVLPRLAADRDRWQLLAPFRPGLMPFTRLRKVLAMALAAFPDAAPGQAHEAEVIALGRQLDWLQAQAERPVLLVIDQLEELLVEGNAEAERFLAFLEGLLRRELSGLVVLATLRTDFLAVLESRWPGLTELVETTTPEPIPPQRFGELISGPAARADLRLQPGLAERLVAESGGRDALPLLAFTLEKLWRKRQERGAAVVEPNGARWDLTLADYGELKGVDGVVGTQAELCWDPQRSDRADSEALQRAFVHHLLRLNEEGLATKQPARWGDLPERSRPLLQRFVEARLLVRGSGDGGDQVEIAHEALLRTWEPLVGWIEANRKKLEQRRRVARLCGDLAKEQPPQARLAALQGLLALAETDPEAVAPAAGALGAVLANPDGDPREGPLAFQLLELVGGDAGVAGLSAFLGQGQILELQEPALAAPRLKLLCQAASLLQRIHRYTPPAASGTARWLLLPSATVRDDGRAVRTELVRLRLWATPKLETPGAWLEPLGEGVALTMVTIPPGRFVMGSPPDEAERKDSEDPQHLVELEGFWMGQTPISQAQWRQVMGTNPSKFQGDRTDRDQRPVERVSWEEAMAFCAKLRERTGRHYSLPSEAQWEYACRAGTTTPFHCGATLISELANFNGTYTYGAAPKGVVRKETSQLDQFPANRWGLLDLHGNVWEWCLDEWHSSYDGAPKDGRAWLERQGSSHREPDGRRGARLLRGGSWTYHPAVCRSACRNYDHPGTRGSYVGFRVCCLPQDQLLYP